MNRKTQLEKVIHSSYSNIGGMVVRKSGETVYEKYFNGCTASDTLHIFSVTKSIISMLIGVAIDRGHIRSIDQKVLEFFPEYTVKSGEQTIQKITLKDLLTMTAPYKYKSEPYKDFFTSDDWVKASLDLLGGTGKIGDFKYTPVIGPDIFSGILINATGQSVLDFATEYLFSPLGITVEGNITFRNQEEQMAFYEARHVRGWVADPTGVNTAGWGLNLTPMDLAKLGQLYLDEGVWRGEQLISQGWIRDSTREQSRWGELAYGYLWWLMDETEHSFAAMGDGGNVIYVNAKKEIVISIASLFVKNAKDRIKLIKDYIEPMFDF